MNYIKLYQYPGYLLGQNGTLHKVSDNDDFIKLVVPEEGITIKDSQGSDVLMTTSIIMHTYGKDKGFFNGRLKVRFHENYEVHVDSAKVYSMTDRFTPLHPDRNGMFHIDGYEMTLDEVYTRAVFKHQCETRGNFFKFIIPDFSSKAPISWESRRRPKIPNSNECHILHEDIPLDAVPLLYDIRYVCHDPKFYSIIDGSASDELTIGGNVILYFEDGELKHKEKTNV